MDTFVLRIAEEKQDLVSKISKLQSFILSEEYNKLDSISAKLLSNQLSVMIKYNQILADRLALLSIKDRIVNFSDDSEL